jgi:hypothetical protein
MSYPTTSVCTAASASELLLLSLGNHRKTLQVSVVKEKTDIIGNWGLGPMDDDAFGRKLPNYAVRCRVVSFVRLLTHTIRHC